MSVFGPNQVPGGYVDVKFLGQSPRQEFALIVAPLAQARRMQGDRHQEFKPEKTRMGFIDKTADLLMEIILQGSFLVVLEKVDQFFHRLSIFAATPGDVKGRFCFQAFRTDRAAGISMGTGTLCAERRFVQADFVVA